MEANATTPKLTGGEIDGDKLIADLKMRADEIFMILSDLAQISKPHPEITKYKRDLQAERRVVLAWADKIKRGEYEIS